MSKVHCRNCERKVKPKRVAGDGTKKAAGGAAVGGTAAALGVSAGVGGKVGTFLAPLTGGTSIPLGIAIGAGVALARGGGSAVDRVCPHCGSHV